MSYKEIFNRCVAAYSQSNFNYLGDHYYYSRVDMYTEVTSLSQVFSP